MPGAKKEKDPNMPKRPLTPYFAFSADERPKVRAEHPDWKVTEVAKELGRRYVHLTQVVKLYSPARPNFLVFTLR